MHVLMYKSDDANFYDIFDLLLNLVLNILK